MKKALSLILALVLCLSLFACGLSDTENSQNTEPSITLEPLTEFPAFSEKFQIIADNIDIDQQALETFFGYAYAAYHTYDAEAFCQYISEELDFSVFDDIEETLKSANPSDAELKMTLVSRTTDLMSIGLTVAQNDTAFVEIKAKQSDESYEEVMKRMVSTVNEYAVFVYGEKLLITAV